MEKENWVETKREYSINDVGEQIPTKVTKELTTSKRWIDKLLKNVPLILVCTTLIGMYIQQNNLEKQRALEVEKQSKLFRLETFIATTSSIQMLLNKPFKSDEFRLAKDELFFKLYPKIKFINDTTIIKQVDTITACINLFEDVKNKLHELNNSILSNNQIVESIPDIVADEIPMSDRYLPNEVADETNLFYKKFYEFTSEVDAIKKSKGRIGISLLALSSKLRSLDYLVNKVKNYILERNKELERLMIFKSGIES